MDRWLAHASTKSSPGQLYVNSWQDWLAARYRGSDRIVFGKHLQHPVRAEVASLSGGDSLDDFLAAGERAASNLLAAPPAAGGILDKIESFHLAGGGYLNLITKAHFAHLSFMAALAKSLGVPIFGTGLGLMPLNGTNRLYEVLSTFRFIEARDIESFDWLTSVGLKSVAISGLDDTFISPVVGGAPSSPRRLIVNVQSDMGGSHLHSTLLRVMKDYIHTYSRDFSDLLYVSFFDKSDVIFHEALQQALGISISLLNKSDLLADGLPFSPSDVVISSRFHCHLLAARCGASGLYIVARKGYYDVKHKSILDIGSGWISFLDDPPGPSELLPPAIDEQGQLAKKAALLTAAPSL
ncbi:hypothetical protein GCM10010994_56310 [Chelatococcus reniformis]|uniref:Polysaccharide pyruvyl transferase domain-containing protein n=1 Tax=Chelatococcus reniformis TaxID=1494448 RepID=A0A916UYB2_9HYPH|nr:hypothetical protein GCM10010994_56310 [Chelatococcus reniformis]